MLRKATTAQDDQNYIELEDDGPRFVFDRVTDSRAGMGAACVAAMVTGCSVEALERFAGLGMPWYTAELLAFLASRGWFSVLGACWDNGGRLADRDEVRLGRVLSLRENVALLIGKRDVEPEHTDRPLLWDTRHVLDPLSRWEDESELRRYIVKELYFLGQWTGPRPYEKALR